MAIIVLFAIGSGIVAYMAVIKLDQQMARIQEIIIPNTVALREANRAGIQVQAAVRSIALNPEDAQGRKNLISSLNEFPQLMADLERMARRDSVKEFARSATKEWAEQIAPKVLSVNAALEEGNTEKAKRVIVSELNPAWRKLKLRLEEAAKAREEANNTEFIQNVGARLNLTTCAR